MGAEAAEAEAEQADAVHEDRGGGAVEAAVEAEPEERVQLDWAFERNREMSWAQFKVTEDLYLQELEHWIRALALRLIVASRIFARLRWRRGLVHG